MKSGSVHKILLNGGYNECWHQKSPSKHEMNDAQKVGVRESCKYSLNNKLTSLEIEKLKLCPLPTQPPSDQLTTVNTRDIAIFRKKEKYWRSSFIWNAITVALTKCTLAARMAKRCCRWCRRWGCGWEGSWRDRWRGTGAGCYRGVNPWNVNTFINN